jgi:hypothetical protein
MSTIPTYRPILETIGDSLEVTAEIYADGVQIHIVDTTDAPARVTLTPEQAENLAADQVRFAGIARAAELTLQVSA